MSWRAITEADVLSKMSSPELEAFRATAIAGGQADPITTAIDQVTELVRGYVGSNSKNTVDTDNPTFIPERLISPAVDILVVDIPARAAGVQIDPEDARAKAKAQAVRLLERVADNKFSIDDPVTGNESSSGGASVVNPRTQRVTRENLKGL